jgi:hypothetical protein
VTERIEQLLAIKDGVDFALLDALDEADRADALGRVLDPDDPNRVGAMAILAHNDPEGALSEALGQVIQEGQLDIAAAAAAVTVAGRLGPNAIPVVMGAAAAQPPPIVALAAWRTLAEIGRAEFLDALQQIAPPPGDVVGDQAAFALSVIAYRAGISGFELNAPDETRIRVIPDVETLFSINQSEPSESDFELLRRVPRNELYGVEPTREGAIAIDCGDDHMLLSLDSDVQFDIPNTLLAAPALAGVIAILDSLGSSYSTRYLILTWPDGVDGFHVALHQPDGAQAYYGHPNGEEIAGSEVSFGLFALDLPGLTTISLRPVVSPSGVFLGGDRLAMTEVLTDRLEPEAG